MEREKKPEFVVTDRRKFTVEGEPRPDAPVESSSPEIPAPAAEASAAGITPPQPSTAPTQQQSQPTTPKAEKPAAKPKSAEASRQPSAADSGPDLATGYSAERERASFGGQKMEFVHLLDMLVQTAMMYAGAMDTGAERRVDVVGLRQMIDLIAVLQEKTRGNLSEEEEAVLKNTIFQLRMTYMEIVNMIDRQAMQKGRGGPATGPARK